MNAHGVCGNSRQATGACALLFVFGLALIGCSSGGGSDTMPDEPSMMVTPPANEPDLLARFINVESSGVVETGDSITISAEVLNSGDGNAPATRLRYYLSEDSTISTENDTEVGDDAVDPLNAGDASEERVTINAPSSAGTYYYGACVDRVSGESNTDNNCTDGVSVRVGGPWADLVAGIISIEATDVFGEDSIEIVVEVENVGDGDSPPTQLRVFRSDDGTVNSDDPEVDSSSVSSLSPGETDREPILFEAPSNDGTYYYYACVDSVPDEFDESNNCTNVGQITIGSPSSGTPDLVVWTISVGDSTVDTAGSVEISAQVRNIGSGDSSATVLIYFHSTDSIISISDTFVGSDNVARLTPEEIDFESIRVDAPSSAGTYFYGACVDSVPDESNVDNNCSSGIQVSVSDG